MFRRFLICLFGLACFASASSTYAASASSSSSRTVFVQLFEWPWQDVAQECEVYLGPAGFAAVQVSPPHEHINSPNHPWWERYQVVSYKINSRNGNEADFTDMVRRCKKAGVDIYVDTILNHMAGVAGGTGYAGSSFTHYNYPGIYNNDDFHHCGRNGNDEIVNFGDLFELQNCQLVGLADLKTESPSVQNTLAAYMNHLLDLGVAGFRLDASKHIPPKDLLAITAKLKRKAYVYEEVIYDPTGPITYADYTPVGDVTAYDFPYRLGRAIKGKRAGDLLSIASGFPDSSDAISFVMNHDLERNTSTDLLKFNSADQNFYRLAQIFTLAFPYGYPQLFSGYNFSDYDQGPPVDSNGKSVRILNDSNQCQAPWSCEHRLPEVAAMVDFRNQTDGAFFISNWWSNGTDAISFSRGSLGFVAINFSASSLSQQFTTGLADGNYCNMTGQDYKVSSRTCSNSFTVANGKVNATLSPYSALVFITKARTKEKK